jgi:pyridinium-3,5-biscarboxylic acid mononucleotide synthase
MDTKQLQSLLEQFKANRIPIEELISQLTYQDLHFAKIDHHRNLRCGFPEIIYGENKSVHQLTKILEKLLNNEGPVLATRINEKKGFKLKADFPELEYNVLARTLARYTDEKKLGTVAVMCAGTSDLPVAEEALVTVNVLGFEAIPIYDVGVAGIHRIGAALEKIKACDVIIVIAGMDGALPSVIGGLISQPVIAVPTSVGYGAAFGGIAPLLTMLNSCASGITVMNIDNGFGAALAAIRILNQCNRFIQ